jgi:hypothetical protein
MSTFSNLLDISSFFIGVLVNLLLVAMICFYFKRKIDNLEISQSEQAKMLFQIIQQQSNTPVTNTYGMLNNLDLTQLDEDETTEDAIHSESVDEPVEPLTEDEEESGDEEESDDEEESGDEEVNEAELPQVKTIEYETVEDTTVVQDVEKMTIKELRTILEDKGVSLSKKNMKKQELIEIYMDNQESHSEMIEEVVKVDDLEVENDESSGIVLNTEEITE